jgi:DNA-binding HxlR family transcriptional regulator
MVMEILRHTDYLRVLSALRKADGLRFNQIQKSLDLNPTQVNRALKALTEGLWIIPQTVPTETGRIPVEYKLGKRGALFLELFDNFRAEAASRSAELGADEVQELQKVCA